MGRCGAAERCLLSSMVPPYQPMSALPATRNNLAGAHQAAMLSHLGEDMAGLGLAGMNASCGVHTVSSAMMSAPSSVAVRLPAPPHSTRHGLFDQRHAGFPPVGQMAAGGVAVHAWFPPPWRGLAGGRGRFIATCATSSSGARAPIFILKMWWRFCSSRRCASCRSRHVATGQRPGQGRALVPAAPAVARQACSACELGRPPAPFPPRFWRRRCPCRHGPCVPERSQKAAAKLAEQCGCQVLRNGVEGCSQAILRSLGAADRGRLAKTAGTVLQPELNMTGLYLLMEPNDSLCGRMVGMSRMRAPMRSMAKPARSCAGVSVAEDKRSCVYGFSTGRPGRGKGSLG